MVEDLGPTRPEQRGIRPEDNTEPKFLVVLLDISDSMGMIRPGQSDPPIAELNSKLARYIQLLPTLSFGTDGGGGQLAIAAFYEAVPGEPTCYWLPLGTPVRAGSSVHYAAVARITRSDGTPVNLAAGGLKLVPRGLTPLGYAVGQALDCIDEHVDELRALGRSTNPRPVLLVLTDGLPTDPDVVQTVTTRVHAMERDNKLAFWIGGMEGASRVELAKLADKGNLIELGDQGIDSFLRLMSQSVDAAQGARRTAQMIYADLNRKLAALRATAPPSSAAGPS